VSDEDLLATLNSMQASLKSDLKAEISSAKVDLLEHIHGVGAQLHTQIQEVVERLDRMEARLNLQGGLIQGGSRAITRMIEWTESGDMTFSRYDRRLAILEKRLEAVEGNKNGK
jgi:DNA repair protein RadC